jgi:hypothetical protein
MKTLSKTLIAASLFTLTAGSPAFAANYKVEVQNINRGIYFAPLLISAHPTSAKTFTAGMAASVNLQRVAEGGDIAGLTTDMTNVSAKVVANPAGGLLAPGASTMADLGEPGAANTHLTVVGMIVPSNDGFIALNNIHLPTAPGIYVYTVNGYDAGTEANDEMRGGGAPGVAGFGVPAPLEMAVGTGATGIPDAVAEGFIHIHPGHIGDLNKTGGTSDLDAGLHRWLNPMARVTVTVE